jgi:hypothetical protein
MDIKYYSNAFIVLREVLQCPFLAVYALVRLHISHDHNHTDCHGWLTRRCTDSNAWYRTSWLLCDMSSMTRVFAPRSVTILQLQRKKKTISRTEMNAYDDEILLFPAIVVPHILPEVVRSDCENKRIL